MYHMCMQYICAPTQQPMQEEQVKHTQSIGQTDGQLLVWHLRPCKGSIDSGSTLLSCSWPFFNVYDAIEWCGVIYVVCMFGCDDGCVMTIIAPLFP